VITDVRSKGVTPLARAQRFDGLRSAPTLDASRVESGRFLQQSLGNIYSDGGISIAL
jgi:hypothetical protein